MHGNVSMKFLCALNVYFGGDQEIPKNAMREFYQNIPMQTLSKNIYEVINLLYNDQIRRRNQHEHKTSRYNSSKQKIHSRTRIQK